MLIVKLAVSAVVICIFSLTLKKEYPDYSFLVATLGGICLLAIVLQKLEPVMGQLQTLAQVGSTEAMQCLLHVLGIALAAQFAADCCKDAGLGAAASAVELCGRGLALLEAMPLVQQLASLFASYLQ